MKQQILSLAFTLPILIASASSSFAGEAVKKPAIIPNLTVKPVVKPVVIAPVIAGGQQVNRPGTGTVGTKPPKPPSPPRRVLILLNQHPILQPALDSNLPNPNINRAPGY